MNIIPTYTEELNQRFVFHFGITTEDAGLDEADIQRAMDRGETPDEYARDHGERYGLDFIEGKAANIGLL